MNRVVMKTLLLLVCILLQSGALAEVSNWEYNELVDDYNDLLDKNDGLVDAYNDLLNKNSDLVDRYNQQLSDYKNNSKRYANVCNSLSSNIDYNFKDIGSQVEIIQKYYNSIISSNQKTPLDYDITHEFVIVNGYIEKTKYKMLAIFENISNYEEYCSSTLNIEWFTAIRKHVEDMSSFVEQVDDKLIADLKNRFSS